MSYSPEQIEEQAARVGIVGEDVGKTRSMLRAYAATLRQQAARVDEVDPRVLRAFSEVGAWAGPRLTAALEAALSAQPAERQGDDGVAEILAALPHCSARTTFTFSRDKLQALLRQAAPVGVPDGAVDTRDHFGPPCVAVVFDTQENANKYRDRLTEALQLRQNTAAAPSAPQGVA